MSNGDSKQLNDPRLHPYLMAHEEHDEAGQLAQLLGNLKSFIRQQTRAAIKTDATLREWQEDIEQEVQHDLLTRLRALKAMPTASPIENFPGYVTMVITNCVRNHRRAQSPWVRRLRRRLQYELQEQGSFAGWGTAICGFVAWKGQPAAQSENLTRIRDNPLELFVWGQRATPALESLNMAELLADIFNFVGHPLRYQDLEKIILDLFRMDFHPLDESDEVINAKGTQPHFPASPMELIQQREWLQWVWQEASTLPDEQRAVYLLSNEVTGLLWETGIASFSQIAAQTGLPKATIATLWQALPLPDREVAELLQLTPDQVKNRRAKAMQRLGRHWRRQGAPGATGASA